MHPVGQGKRGGGINGVIHEAGSGLGDQGDLQGPVSVAQQFRTDPAGQDAHDVQIDVGAHISQHGGEVGLPVRVQQTRHDLAICPGVRLGIAHGILKSARRMVVVGVSIWST